MIYQLSIKYDNANPKLSHCLLSFSTQKKFRAFGAISIDKIWKVLLCSCPGRLIETSHLFICKFLNPHGVQARNGVQRRVALAVLEI